MSLTQVQTVSNDELILTCVDRGLESVGRYVKNAVYWHLEKVSHVSKYDIPAKPTAFIQGLRAVYGESSLGVENAILHELNVAFRMNYSVRQGLVSAISEAKEKQ